MNSLELRSKSKDEMLEWRAAIEVAMTPSATSIQAQIDETKDLYSQMADVIQKHIDELGESQSSTALQVCCRENASFLRVTYAAHVSSSSACRCQSSSCKTLPFCSTSSKNSKKTRPCLCK